MLSLYIVLVTAPERLRDRLAALHRDEAGALNTTEIALLLVAVATVAIAFGVFITQRVTDIQNSIPGGP